MGKGKKNRLHLLRETTFPHSVGLVYTSVTHYLGFRPWSGEGKVMGLAAYGDPARYLPAFRQIIRPTPEGFAVDMSYFRYHVRFWREWASQKFIDTFGPPRLPESALERRHEDIRSCSARATTSRARRPRCSPRGRSSAGSRGAWRWGRARSATAPSWPTRAAPR